MSPRLPFSLDQALGLPGQLAAALRTLAAIAENTEAMERHTRVLEEVSAALKDVASHTGALPGLRSDMERVAETTGVLEPMDGRMASIADTMPVLVDVQKHLTRVPETIERLDRRTYELNTLLERLLESMQGLSVGIEELQGSVGPLGRFARRLPGGSKEPKERKEPLPGDE